MGKIYRHHITKYILTLALAGNLISPAYSASPKDSDQDEQIIRLGSGMSVISVTHPMVDFDPTQPLEPQTLTRSNYYPYPTVPLAGFTPYVAVSLSNKKAYDEFEWEHSIESKYSGNPLKTGSTVPYVIGVLDTGAEVDIIAGSASSTLGITRSYLTGDEMAIGGVGSDSVYADVTTPIGFFFAGLGDIGPDSKIDPNNYVGHSNNMMLSAPAIVCGGQEAVSALAGRASAGFFTSVIRNDQRKSVTVGDKTYAGPDIEFLPAGSAEIPAYSYRIPIGIGDNLTGAQTTVTTASYYYWEGIGVLNPTILSTASSFLSFGASFTIEAEITHNGRTKTFNFMFDTGAQSTILSTNAADSLGLPLNGDFFVDICGVSGVIEDIPGYYLDQVDIYGGGGALNFSHVPVIVTDTASVYDGILGMNFFYDRNITFAPVITASGSSCKLYVSDPVHFAETDMNGDGTVNMADFSVFAKSWLAGFGQPSYNPKCDLFLSDMVDQTDLEILLGDWLK